VKVDCSSVGRRTHSSNSLIKADVFTLASFLAGAYSTEPASLYTESTMFDCFVTFATPSLFNLNIYLYFHVSIRPKQCHKSRPGTNIKSLR
jgi:hypothetical protein